MVNYGLILKKFLLKCQTKLVFVHIQSYFNFSRTNFLILSVGTSPTILQKSKLSLHVDQHEMYEKYQ
jgi:hypothetical protein